MPQWDITLIIHKTVNVINYGKLNKQESLILLLDFEKAFDSLEFKYLNELLFKMGFGEHFIRALKTLYAFLKAHIKLNNTYSDSFILSRGSRQGCPLLPLLFAIPLEPLPHTIKIDHQIKSITVNQSTYENRTIYGWYGARPINSIDWIQSFLNCFGNISGLHVNFSKSEIYPISNSNCLKNAYLLRFNING